MPHVLKSIFKLHLVLLLLWSSCAQQTSIVRSTEINTNPVRVKERVLPLEKHTSLVKEHDSIALPSYSVGNNTELDCQQASCSLLKTGNEEIAQPKRKGSVNRAAMLKDVPKIAALRKPHHDSKIAGVSTTHWAATVSLVMGILGFFLLPFIGSVAAIVFGLIALNKIGEEGSTYTGKQMAIAGMVLGILGLLLIGLFLGIFLATFV